MLRHTHNVRDDKNTPQNNFNIFVTLSQSLNTTELHVDCDSENFTLLKFFGLYYLRTENFQAIFYAHIRHSSLRQTAKFYYIIHKFGKVMP